MSMIGGLDVHRKQITYDWVDGASGAWDRGRAPADRVGLRGWLARLPGQEGDFAVEATTGWRFVVEELEAAGFTAHLAEPAETSAARGPKKRAKTDGADAKHLRELVEQQRLWESWIPPAHVLDLRETVRLRQTLMETATEWQQRLHAVLYHHGVGKPTGELTREDNRRWLRSLALPASARQVIRVGLGQIDAARAEQAPIDRWLARYARQQPGCRALLDLYGVGAVTAPTLLAEMGDARRFANGEAIVRYAGLDITVHSSDGKRSPGQLAKQGPETLRWALFEAAKLHSRRGAPEHALYRDVKRRTDGQRAALTVARKLARQARHVLIALGDDALAPVDLDGDADLPAAA